MRDKVNELINLTLIKDVKVRQAYMEQRRPWLARMLALFLISKIIHIIYVVSIVAQDKNEYLASDQVLTLAYPLTNQSDAMIEKFEAHSFIVLCQYSTLFIVNVVALIMTKKMEQYYSWVPWMVALV